MQINKLIDMEIRIWELRIYNSCAQAKKEI